MGGGPGAQERTVRKCVGELVSYSDSKGRLMEPIVEKTPEQVLKEENAPAILVTTA